MSHQTSQTSLVAFTSLAIGGAGLIAANALAMLPGQPTSLLALSAGLALLAAGLVVSLTHLGRPGRAPKALRRTGQSALSNEVLLCSIALGCGAMAAAEAAGVIGAWWVRPAAGAVAVIFLLSIGLVYRLGGQLTWRSATVLTPVTSGCAFGVIALQCLNLEDGVLNGVLLVMVIDAAVFVQRWREIEVIVRAAPPEETPWMRRRHQLLAARFFLLFAVPLFLLLAWPSQSIVFVAACGLLVDRFGFYALALHQTTEVEASRIDAVIESGAGLQRE